MAKVAVVFGKSDDILADCSASIAGIWRKGLSPPRLPKPEYLTSKIWRIQREKHNLILEQKGYLVKFEIGLKPFEKFNLCGIGRVRDRAPTENSELILIASSIKDDFSNDLFENGG